MKNLQRLLSVAVKMLEDGGDQKNPKLADTARKYIPIVMAMQFAALNMKYGLRNVKIVIKKD